MNTSPKLLYSGAYEGDPFSKLHRYIAETGYNNDVTVLTATVTKAPPNLEIKLDADGLVIDKDLLVVARHLVKHKRIITMNRTSEQVEIEFQDELSVGDRVLVLESEEDSVYYIIDHAHYY